jgi:hypothetical protein
MVLELTVAFEKIVLANTLEEKELTIRRPSVRDEMRGSRYNLIAAADLKHALIIGISGINCQRASQNEVVIRTLAVVMPRNDVTGRQCEDARLNVDAFRNHFNIFDGIILAC